MIRTTNNVTRTLLFQASMPPSYWADALATANLLLNRLPTTTLRMSTPFFALYSAHPSYHDLRAFGCTCYPNLTATTPHKLAPRSALCVFIGYSPDHKGYRCLNLATNRVIISRHVVFDETTFPFSLRRPSPPPQELDFLTNDDPLPVFPLPAGTPGLAGSLPAPTPPHARSQPSPPVTPMAGLGTPTPRSPPPGFPVLRPLIAPATGSRTPGPQKSLVPPRRARGTSGTSGAPSASCPGTPGTRGAPGAPCSGASGPRGAPGARLTSGAFGSLLQQASCHPRLLQAPSCTRLTF